MRHRQMLATIGVGLGTLALWAAPAGAQSAITPGPKQWGGQENTIVVPLSRFVPFFPGVSYNMLQIGPTTFVPYYQNAGQSAIYLWASVDLPPGSDVTDVCLLAFDSTSDDGQGADPNVAFIFSAYETGSTPTFFNNVVDIFGRVLSIGGTTLKPGFATVCDTPYTAVPPTPVFPYKLRGWRNADNDADSGYNHYEIIVILPVAANQVGFGGAYVKYQRTVNANVAAPGFSDSGSFPVWAVQAINALYASGITVGCQAPGDPLTYCWQNPVTRAQMAAFFARAFGLYWKGDATDP